MFYPGVSAGGSDPERYEVPRIDYLAEEARDMYEMASTADRLNGLPFGGNSVLTGINAAYFPENEVERNDALIRFKVINTHLAAMNLNDGRHLAAIHGNFGLAARYGGEYAAVARDLLTTLPPEQAKLRAELLSTLAESGDEATVSEAVNTIWNGDIHPVDKIALYHDLERQGSADASQRIIALAERLEDPLTAAQAVAHFGLLPKSGVNQDYVEASLRFTEQIKWPHLASAEINDSFVIHDEQLPYIRLLGMVSRLSADPSYAQQAFEHAIDLPEDDREEAVKKIGALVAIADFYDDAPDAIMTIGMANDYDGDSMMEQKAEAEARLGLFSRAQDTASHIGSDAQYHRIQQRIIALGGGVRVFDVMRAEAETRPLDNHEIITASDVLCNQNMFGEAYSLQEYAHLLTARSRTITYIARAIRGEIPQITDYT